MANGVNKQIIVGNLGADAEFRYTPQGTPLAKFRLAATTRAGQDKDHTEWFNCVLWGKRAESLSQYLIKGKRVYVEGETRTSSWEDDKNERRYRTEVVVRELSLQPQGGRRDDGAGDEDGGGD